VSDGLMGVWTSEGRKDRFEKLLSDSRLKIDNLLLNADGYEGFMLPYQSVIAKIHEEFTPISHLNAVNNSTETQDLFNHCLELYTDFFTEINQSKAIYSKIKDIQYNNRDESKDRLYYITLKEFELEGVHLSQDERSRIKEINLQLSKLSTDFFQNILNDTKKFELIVDDRSILGDMPEEDVNTYCKDGKYYFNLTAPSYSTFMKYCTDESLREKMFKAYFERAPQNSALIEEILKLRKDKANLLGFKSFADLSLQTKTAKDPENVLNFLKNLGEKTKPYLKQDLEKLKEESEMLGLGDLKAYNIPFLMEQIRRRELGLKEDEIRRFFEQKRTVEGLINFVSEFFGLEFISITEETWHPKVIVYDVRKDGRYVGKLYFDLEARIGKRDGAWMNEWLTRYRNDKGEIVYPVVFIVANFPPSNGDTPSLLKHSDVETLFHEMGHALHHLLSNSDDYFISGINGVEWDVVEFPSQFLENFAFDEKVLTNIGIDFYTGKRIGSDIVSKIKKERSFFAGYQMGRQLEFGIFDMLIHQDAYSAEEVDAILKETRRMLGTLEQPDYAKFQNQFSHIFSGGYAAGYYSYKWAEVLSADLFVKHNKKVVDGKKIASYLFASGGAINIYEEYLNELGTTPYLSSIFQLYGL
jgi:oligopeptidase A